MPGLDHRPKLQLQAVKRFDFTELFFFTADIILRDVKKVFYSQKLSMFASLSAAKVLMDMWTH